MSSRRSLSIAALTVVAAALVSRPAAATNQTFSAGSLIIPTQSSFQDACGAVSVYGLVYQLLRSNGPGGLNAAHPINVHWVYSSSKSAANRCVPTNADLAPDGSAWDNPAWNDGCDFHVATAQNQVPVEELVHWDGAKDASNQSVPFGGGATAYRMDTTDALGKALAYPNFPYSSVAGLSVAIPDNGIQFATPGRPQTGLPIDGSKVWKVGYMGGAFVIDTSDAVNFINWLNSGDSAVKPFNTTLETSAAIGATSPSSTTALCNAVVFKYNNTDPTSKVTLSSNLAVFTEDAAGTSVGPVPGYARAAALSHFVHIHRARTQFQANVGARMNARPHKLALVQTVDGSYLDEYGSVHNPTYNFGYKDSNGNLIPDNPGIKGSALDDYLRSAGMAYVFDGGGNLTAPNGCAANSRIAGNTTLCPPNAPTDPVYDKIDAMDLCNSDLNVSQGKTIPASCVGLGVSGVVKFAFSATDPKQGYGVIWAPHWEVNSNYDPSSTHSGSGQCKSDCAEGALAAIDYFTRTSDASGAGRGFMAECASIASFEGAKNPVVGYSYQGMNSFNDSRSDTNVNTQFMTCPTSPESTAATQATTPPFTPNPNACACTPTPGQPGQLTCTGVGRQSLLMRHDRGLRTSSGDDARTTIAARLPNCTDPTPASDAPVDHMTACTHVGAANSAFAQIGDFRWFNYDGSVANFLPGGNFNSNGYSSRYAPGAVPLISTLTGASVANAAQSPRNYVVADNLVYARRENQSSEAQIIYLGGHSYSSDIAGTRVALNTLLALGFTANSSETAVAGPTPYSSALYYGSYFKMLNQNPPSEWVTFSGTTASQWRFPLNSGAFYRAPLSQLVTGGQNYVSPSTSEASVALPVPSQRNIFTYLGGGPRTNAMPGGLGQGGWKPVKIDIDSLGTNCVDDWSLQKFTPTSGSSYWGLGQGSAGPLADSVCDLQEALQINVTPTLLNTGKDAVLNELKSTTNKNMATTVLGIVRGYCYGTSSHVDDPTQTPVLDITPADCNDSRQLAAYDTSMNTGGSRRTRLGAIIHSQAAILDYSKTFVKSTPSAAHRPVVAFVGARDGQLHAFYVPTDGGDSTYTDADGGEAGPFANASSTFNTPLTAPPAGALTELWSFIPPGQLPLLQSNSAEVDSTPAVADVFADFTGSGIRTWHTVLVSSAGPGSREIFALDVTNPYKPALLWDINSSSTAVYAPVELMNNNLGIADKKAYVWQNRCSSPAAGSCSASSFDLFNPPSSPYAGVLDFSKLGASQGVSIGQVRVNGQPEYRVFVATNDPGGNGLHVFSIDVVTGQKNWQFDNPFDQSRADPSWTTYQKPLVGNSTPPNVSIITSQIGQGRELQSAYIGDDQGDLWEIDPSFGLNKNSYALASGCSPAACNYPLINAFYNSPFNNPQGQPDQGQPVSTTVTFFTVPASVVAPAALANYQNHVLLAFGTAGTDAASGLNPPPNGAVHLMDIVAKHSPAQIASDSVLAAQVAQKGVGIEIAGLPVGLTDERVTSPVVITIDGQLVFGTTRADKLGNLESISVFSNSLIPQIVATGSAAGPTGGGGPGAIGGTVGTDSSGAIYAVTNQNLYKLPAPSNHGDLVGKTNNGKALSTLKGWPSVRLGWIFRKYGHAF